VVAGEKEVRAVNENINVGPHTPVFGGLLWLAWGDGMADICLDAPSRTASFTSNNSHTGLLGFSDAAINARLSGGTSQPSRTQSPQLPVNDPSSSSSLSSFRSEINTRLSPQSPASLEHTATPSTPFPAPTGRYSLRERKR
jgi:hypothetical protein